MSESTEFGFAAIQSKNDGRALAGKIYACTLISDNSHLYGFQGRMVDRLHMCMDTSLKQQMPYRDKISEETVMEAMDAITRNILKLEIGFCIELHAEIKDGGFIFHPRNHETRKILPVL